MKPKVYILLLFRNREKAQRKKLIAEKIVRETRWVQSDLDGEITRVIFSRRQPRQCGRTLLYFRKLSVYVADL